MSCVLLMCTIIGNTDTDSDADIYRTLYVVMRRDKFVVLFRIWGFASRGCSLDLLVSSQGHHHDGNHCRFVLLRDVIHTRKFRSRKI